MPKGEGQPAAPTGCFKCGRPGHWSRDCPSSSASNSNPNPNPDSRPNFPTNSFKQPSEATEPVAAAKKARRSRPKLTPEILLSDDGLGYVLRHFPRAFKYHGPNHEVEQVGASRRVRRCMDELRERVARGGDPTKLHETPADFDDQGQEPAILSKLTGANKVTPNGALKYMTLHPEQCGDEGNGAEETIFNTEDPPMEDHGQDPVQEDMINEIYQMTANNESSETPCTAARTLEPPEQTTDGHERGVTKTKIQITEEQRARMEANRSKALERAKRARASQTAP